MSLFDGTKPFVAGSVTGVRTFEVAIDGRLHPPSHDTSVTYVDGINYARCMSSHAMTSCRDYGTPPRKREPLDHSKVMKKPGYDRFYDYHYGAGRTPHDAGNLNCSCGFYAFKTFERSVTSIYASTTTVQAVVEGFGTVTVGDEGFRAEKLRIKALIIRGVPRFPRFHAASEWWCKKKLAIATFLITTAILFFNFFAILFGVYEDWWGTFGEIWASWIVIAVVMPIMLVNNLAIRYSARPKASYAYAFLDKIKENYPSVTIYPSAKQALKDHPVSDFKALAKGKD